MNQRIKDAAFHVERRRLTSDAVVDGVLKDLSTGIGTVGDRCSVPRCRQPAAMRYVGRDLCARHWDEEASR